VERRILGDRDLVLDGEAAAGAAELPELGLRVDEAARVADDRVAGLDRQVVPHAARLVIGRHRAEIGRAPGAAPAAAAHREVLRSAQRLLRVELFPGWPAYARQAHFLPQQNGLLVIFENDPVDCACCLHGDVAVVDVGLHLGRVALKGIAEAARGRPQHRVHVGGVLREVLLAQLQRLLVPFHL
jgi:hypothetical protein